MEQLLTIVEAAERLQVSPATIYRLLRQDPPLPSHKIGSSRRFAAEEIDRWLAERSKTQQ